MEIFPAQICWNVDRCFLMFLNLQYIALRFLMYINALLCYNFVPKMCVMFYDVFFILPDVLTNKKFLR